MQLKSGSLAFGPLRRDEYVSAEGGVLGSQSAAFFLRDELYQVSLVRCFWVRGVLCLTLLFHCIIQPFPRIPPNKMTPSTFYRCPPPPSPPMQSHLIAAGILNCSSLPGIMGVRWMKATTWLGLGGTAGTGGAHGGMGGTRPTERGRWQLCCRVRMCLQILWFFERSWKCGFLFPSSSL